VYAVARVAARIGALLLLRPPSANTEDATKSWIIDFHRFHLTPRGATRQQVWSPTGEAEAARLR
jgi:hypothetical protein